MNKRLKISALILILVQPLLIGQAETYTVSKTPFSSDRHDEFCPVFYADGLVFTSNADVSSLASYLTSESNGVFNIYYTSKDDNGNWSNPRLFSRNIKTRYNDGPSTFNRRYDTIYYSRNLHVKGSLRRNAYARNKLGIFYSTHGEEEWSNVREMRVNNEWYNVTTPYLSPDGKRLYFSSDDPEGYGGTDLYYLPWKGNYWGNPVNLGPVINTKGNESYPFVNQAGELLFSSDGHGGLGGKDIFYTRFADTAWINPVHIDAPVNSAHDDFGITTDPLMNEGYFSSNRDGSVDIYHFKTLFPQIFYRDIQKENQYCFVFDDSGSVVLDTTYLQYLWTFGDDRSARGAVVKHCFPGPGDYDIRLDIIEKNTGRLFCSKLNYTLELRDFKQPYIDSPDAAVRGEAVEFDGTDSNLPGWEILSYSWDFGDGTKVTGPVASHAYSKSGRYEVNLTLGVRSDSTGNVFKTGISKMIEIFDGLQNKLEFERRREALASAPVGVLGFSGAEVDTVYSVEENLKKGAVFRVELLSSENRLGTGAGIFSNVPSKYMLEEKYNEETSLYSYYVEWQKTLMATYPAYRELSQRGFNDILVQAVEIKDPAERSLFNLIKVYSTSTGRCFDRSNMLTSHALIMLDQVVNFMRKYPNVKLEVGVHTDSTGSSEANYNLSRARAKTMVDYLINRGIDVARLVAKGYGESKPVAPNYLERDRELNRRIEFRIIND
ncbi:MAG: PKD domain-containing protein [Bacteroidota bacterium]|nr:PKD domain-containing protein [Bacteroidota bacterium]